MSTKVRALVWEEFRVGGAIAAVCAMFGVICIVESRWVLGAEAWGNIDELVTPLVLGVPLFVSLLLVLNPNNSGHLSGGYSRRVLWLPVPTWMTVAVSLGVRALLLGAATAILLMTTRQMYVDGPGLFMVPLFVMFYLVVQGVEWLRGAVSGITSLMLVIAAFLLVLVATQLVGAAVYHRETAWGTAVNLWFLDFAEFSERLWTLGAGGGTWTLALATALTGTLIYGVSVYSVHAVRLGRRTGIPEIWEWRRSLMPERVRADRIFQSPLAAQTWFEVQRAGNTLPVATVAIWALVSAPLWLYDPKGSWTPISFLPFPALLLAAAIHGLRTRVVGFRKPVGLAGFSYLQPLTSAQFAGARVFANLLILVPSCVLVLAIHYAMVIDRFPLALVPFAFGLGLDGVREFVWLFIGRGILVALPAWGLMVIGTRVFRSAWLPAVFVPTAAMGVLFALGDSTIETVFPPVFLVFGIASATLTAGTYAYAWGKGLITARAIGAWCLAWFLVAWLIRGGLLAPSTPIGILSQALVCLGYASLVPLPFAALTLDIALRRHGATVAQDSSLLGHAPKAAATPAHRARVWVATGIIVATILWLGWPTEPSYKGYLRERGLPSTWAEQAARYPEVPAKLNLASKYSAAAVEGNRLAVIFEKRNVPDPFVLDEDGDPLPHPIDFVLIRGLASLPDVSPIPDRVWLMTELYWEQVTSHIAPEVIAVVAVQPQHNRFILKESESPQIERLRYLAEEMQLDALHWAVAGDSAKAVDSTLATLVLQEALEADPFLLSQLVRIRMAENIAIESLQTIMNRASLTNGELARLRDGFARLEASFAQDEKLVHALRGACMMQISFFDDVGLNPSGNQIGMRAPWFDPSWVLSGLSRPISSQQMLMVYSASWSVLGDDPLGRSASSIDAFYRNRWAVYGNKRADNGDGNHRAGGIPYPWLITSMEQQQGVTAELTRRLTMKLGMARAGIAVEQFRRANGRLPLDLSELVPDYLPSIPVDVYTRSGLPVKYRADDDGSFVIYSIGTDKLDDRGVDSDDHVYVDDGPRGFAGSKHEADDIVFEVGGAAQSGSGVSPL